MPSSGGHPDPGLLAAHAERRLVGAEAAQLEAHLADCSTCYETFAETVQFLLAEEPAEEPAPDPARVLPFHRRPAFQIAAGLAAAAGLVLAVRYSSLARSPRPSSPLAELAEAMGPTRFIEPRLTGGFQHGRLVVMRSGSAPQGLDAQSPAVLTAVANIRQRTQNDTSPAALAAIAATYLVSGDVAAAVKALEFATAQEPENPRLQSDLAAAYLVRASRLDEPSDIPKALEAAEKAIEKKDAPVEAWFNRALAIEGLHLIDQAKKAWNDYLERDSTTAWAEEARKHLEDLPPAIQSTIEVDRSRARAAIDEGKVGIDRLADEDPSLLRDYFEDQLLPAWADAYLASRPEAGRIAEQTRLVADALFRATTDAMPRAAAQALVSSGLGPSRDPPRQQALGYKSLQEAQRVYEAHQHPPCTAFRNAHRQLEAGGSVYAVWARERIVVTCLYQADTKAALMELGRLRSIGETRGYVRLLARVDWMNALIHGDASAWEPAVQSLRLARERLHKLGDAESESGALVRAAQALRLAKEGRSAWRDRVLALALSDKVRQPARRHVIFSETAQACLEERLFRTALHVQTAVVEAAERWGNATAISDALVWRGLIRHALGHQDATVVADVVEARRWALQIEDLKFNELAAARADAAEGKILASQQSEQAAVCLKRAIASFERMASHQVPGLRLLLARAQAARGLDDEAEHELEAGIRLLESQRTSYRDTSLQASFFEQAASLFDDMVLLQLDKRHDPQRALSFVERGRARQLVESLRSGMKASARLAPLDPKEIAGKLPEGVALVYYSCLPNRILTWVLTRDGTQFFDRSLPVESLHRMIAALEAAIEARAPATATREQAARLFDELVRPLSSALGTQDSIVVVPDEQLQSVPFAGLWDRQSGHYLVEDRLVAMAPSGTVFVWASAKAAAPTQERALRLLAVGNPRVDDSQAMSLPSLRDAEAEAVEVAGLYSESAVLTGRAATKRALLEGARISQVVHFAGHAAASGEDGVGRLVLAPDPQTKQSGILYSYEIENSTLPRTRLVMLAGCSTAAGRTSRLEGVSSLARPFLVAGVPTVISSLWDVDDAVSQRFSVTFHRSLLEGRNPAQALRQAQISFLRDSQPLLAHPASWAGFVVLGGLGRPPLAPSGRLVAGSL